MTIRRILAILLVFSALGCLEAEEQTATPTPEPYGPTEFPPWQKDLRRAEIISFGSLPFVTFMTAIFYDIYRYVDHNQDERYLPWPLKKSDIAIPLSENEQKRIILTAASISVGVAVFDYGFRALRREIRARKIDRENSLIVDPIQITPILDPDKEKVEK